MRALERDPQAAKGHLPGLDGLRAASISIVLFGHFFLHDTAIGFAALGVWVFFAISGFLITRLLLAEIKTQGTVDLVAFYGRRFLRLYPVLILYLAVVVGFTWFARRPVAGLEVASVFAYFTNYLQAWREYHGQGLRLPVGPLWSLSVEEHFYFVLPAVVLITRGKFRALATFAVGASILPLLLRIIYVTMHPEILGSNIIYQLSETRFDSIATGVGLALLCEVPARHRIVAWLSSPWMVLAGLACIAGSVLIRDPFIKDTIRFTLRNFGFLPLVAVSVFGDRIPILNWVLNLPAVVWLGRLSYSLYIWHSGARYFAETLGFNPRGVVGALLLISASFGLASFSYYAVERPALRFKDRFSPGKAGGALKAMNA